LVVTLGAPDPEAPATITAVRRVADAFLLRLKGVGSREEAAHLTGRELRLPRVVLPPLGADEFYVEDLRGCSALDDEGRVLGVVLGTFWNGAHDVMVVADEDQGERLLPVVPEFIVTIDHPNRRVVVRSHD
jgi:16S rRNA processing protein RimM